MPDPSSDMVSRLLKERIIMLGDQVDDSLANALIAQMLYLANENPSEPITMLINSPGGSVSAGLAIYDTMNYLPCEVHTTCVGMAASMGSFLLSSGTKGKRKSFPNAQIMIHQPLGGAGGQAADVEIQVKEIMHTRQKLDTYLAYNTGQPYEKIRDDCDRDFWMTAEEAKEYGLIDEVIQTKTSHIKIPEIPTLAY
uniref:ATP-dependent Clp protease proteolytic subunit n=1 Tax=Chromera velia CCMP2878 TaxID=1169474 RepID=A0A0G4GCG0_9ALVE|eukprot:Cvel_21281.t1-p1 / transcript=Cvel_21281.t1 / gene=Cvel_21281 / organism=Chromera_velia_CCMP2878 / gene_product=ATP-dependent Clp protease proteolytic subunit 2, putative / transcript_product=ATP-dependent Clp protease proteolytic subunit 2, putative / location=Cvel_scaffold1981:15351-16613(+) / protein_length=195 / sequence_SO=supercontig / SO=protein_coding / is_pseudo=false